MALLKFNSTNLALDLVIGLEEEFKPIPELKEIGLKVDALKKETNEFIKDTWGEKPQSELMKLLGKSEKDKQIWKDYLDSTYNLGVIELIKEIKEINKIICPGFKKELDKLIKEEEKKD